MLSPLLMIFTSAFWPLILPCHTPVTICASKNTELAKTISSRKECFRRLVAFTGFMLAKNAKKPGLVCLPLKISSASCSDKTSQGNHFI